MKSLREMLAVGLLLTALCAPASAGWMGTGAVQSPTPEPTGATAKTVTEQGGDTELSTDQSYYDDKLAEVLEVAGSILYNALTLL